MPAAEHSRRKIINTKQGHKIEYDELDASKSKSVIDQIEVAIAQLYSLTEEELDFIINYDIKYGLAGGSEIEDDE
jgi:hypothetical protein